MNGIVITTLLSVLLLLACGNSNNGTYKDYTDARLKVARSYADYASAEYDLLRATASTLNTRADAFTQEPNAQSLADIREALHRCRTQWQNIAPFQFGPAVDVALRSALNTYPTDIDRVEANISSNNYTLGSIENLDAEGYAAIGYLLYGINSSEQQVIENFSSPDASYRINYLLDLTERIQTLTEQVALKWASSSGEYYNGFVSKESLGTDVGSALSLIVNAYELYLQRFLRDGKVGIPAGVRSAGVPRPVAIESYFEGTSVSYLTTSMRAMKQIYTGEFGIDNYALYDYIVELDFQDLADEIVLQWDEVILLAEELEEPLQDQIASDNDAVLAVFLELQKLIPMVKSDMASAMGVIITNQDADGD